MVTGESMSREVPADAGLLCSKASVFGEKIKGTFFFYMTFDFCRSTDTDILVHCYVGRAPFHHCIAPPNVP